MIELTHWDLCAQDRIQATSLTLDTFSLQLFSAWCAVPLFLWGLQAWLRWPLKLKDSLRSWEETVSITLPLLTIENSCQLPKREKPKLESSLIWLANLMTTLKWFQIRQALLLITKLERSLRSVQCRSWRWCLQVSILTWPTWFYQQPASSSGWLLTATRLENFSLSRIINNKNSSQESVELLSVLLLMRDKCWLDLNLPLRTKRFSSHRDESLQL